MKGKKRVGGESASEEIAFRFFLSLQKPLSAVANRKTECPLHAGFGITIGDIGENNRRYFQSTRTFLVNAYFFPGKCLLLSAKMLASFREKPGSPAP